MRISKRILSVILTLAMLMTVMPMAVGATEGDEINTIDLFLEDFEGKEFGVDTEGKAVNTTGLNINPISTSTRINEVVNAKEEEIDDEGIYGDVFLYGANASDGQGVADDNYAMIFYNRGSAGILDGYIDTHAKYLANMKASVDMYLPSDSLGAFQMRFYDTTYDEPSGSTTGETLVSTVKTADGLKAQFLKNNKWDAGIILPSDDWFNLEFAFDFANDKYDVYLDGEQIVDDYELTTLVGDLYVNSFRVTMNNVAYNYAFYLDNYRCYFNIDFDEYFEETYGIPANTNTVWENDFDNAVTTDFTTSAIAGLDMAYTNSNIKITQEADGNKYYTFYPSSGTAHTGNIFNVMGQYFYSNGDDDITDNGIDQYPIDKLKLEFSIKLASLMQTSVNSYYYGTFPATATSNAITNSPMPLISFDANGNIKNAESKTVIGTYEADEWMDFIIYVDYQAHKAYVVKDNEYLGEGSFADAYLYFNQIRFRTASSENSGVAASDLAVSIDNIRYSTTYSNEYIRRQAVFPNPCTTVLGKIDFEDEALNQKITTGYNDDKYYVVNNEPSNVDHVGIVVDDPTLGSMNKVARWHSKNDSNAVSGYKLGIGTNLLKSSDVYTEYGKYPSLVKVEARICKTANGAVYITINNKEVMMWNSSNNLHFVDNGTRKSVGTHNINTWYTITMYLNFSTMKFDAYVDGEYKITCNLNADVKNPEKIAIHGNITCLDKLYVDDITISTLPVFNNEIIKYTAIDGTVKYAYSIDNSTDEAVSYAIIKAAFNDADNTLVPGSVSITTEAVAANTLAVKELDVVSAEEGQYNQYFIWNNYDNDITPLVKSIIIQ